MTNTKEDQKGKQDHTHDEEGHHLKHEVTHSTVEVEYSTLKSTEEFKCGDKNIILTFSLLSRNH